MVGLGGTFFAVLGAHTWEHDSDLDRYAQNAADANSIQWLQRAVRARPDLEDGWRLEAAAASALDLSQAEALARKATALDPWSFAAWQTRSMLDFQANRKSEAIADLERARSVDAGTESHRALANLALVLGDTSTFWREMQTALALGDANDVDPVLSRAVAVATADHRSLAALVPAYRTPIDVAAIQFLLQAQRLSDALEVWRKTSCNRAGGADCRIAAQALADRLIQQLSSAERPMPEAVASLMQVWNRSVGAGVIAQPAAAIGAVTDSLFRYPWAGHGLGWGADAPELVARTPPSDDAPGLASVDLSENTSESLDLLHQFVVLAPGGQYTLSYQVRWPENAGPGSAGLALTIESAAGTVLALLPAPAGGDHWYKAETRFTVPADSAGVLLLRVRYRRGFGQPLLRTTAEIAAIAIRPDAEAGAKR